MQVKLNKYSDFVEKLTSEPSKRLNVLIARMKDIHHPEKCDIPKLMTGSTGLVCEAAELQEIVKKVLYQGKPVDDETLFHMKRELGDIAFYWIMACNGLNFNPEEVIMENVKKLKDRFPECKFEIEKSEKRKKGDL